MSDSEGHIESPEAATSPPADSPMAADDDLFGDGGDDHGNSDSNDDKSDDDNDEGQLSDQPLSEHGLDSDDDDDGARYGEEGARSGRSQVQTREEVLMDVDIFRHRTPKSADGNVGASSWRAGERENKKKKHAWLTANRAAPIPAHPAVHQDPPRRVPRRLVRAHSV